jgi:transcriptional regulator with XRE-family HTH domain
VRLRVTEDVLRQRLAANVRARREAAGLTLQQAADRGEMHIRHWQRVEAGALNATIYTLTRLGDALDADPADLLADPSKPRRGRAT